jgi:hypothetical protein
MDAHIPTTKIRIKTSIYSDQNLIAATQTTAKTTPGVQIIQKQCLQEGNSATVTAQL